MCYQSSSHCWNLELLKDVELKRFIAQLKKEILTEGDAIPDEEGTRVRIIIIISKLVVHTAEVLGFALYAHVHTHAHVHHIVDKVFDDICRDLKESGLYFKYMEAEGPDE